MSKVTTMKIEYKNILISAENVEQYKANGLHEGQRTSEWKLLSNVKAGDGKITLYTYTIDSRLGLPRNAPLRKLVKKINSNHKQTLYHEYHHVHNESQGLRIHIAKAMCFLYIALSCLDEISARTAEELYDMSSTFGKNVKTKIMRLGGKKPEDRAILNAIKSFKTVLPYYCNKWVSSYKKEIGLFNKNDIDMSAILKIQDKLYGYSLNDFKDVLYSQDLYRVVESYFTFNGKCIKNKISESAFERVKKEWELLEVQILTYARDCIKDLQK